MKERKQEEKDNTYRVREQHLKRCTGRSKVAIGHIHTHTKVRTERCVAKKSSLAPLALFSALNVYITPANAIRFFVVYTYIHYTRWQRGPSVYFWRSAETDEICILLCLFELCNISRLEKPIIHWRSFISCSMRLKKLWIC